MKHLILLIAFVCAALGYTTDSWVNFWDAQFVFDCPSGLALSRIASINNNNIYGDRRWDFSCQNIGPLGKCEKTDWVNNWHEDFTYNCPKNMVIVGLESKHINTMEYKCCTFNGEMHTCATSNWVNEFHDMMNVKLDSDEADRRWKMKICTVNFKPVDTKGKGEVTFPQELIQNVV